MKAFSYSELRDYKRCPFYYQQKHVERKKDDGTHDKRSFIGDVLQKLMEEFYVEQWWRGADLETRMQNRATRLCQLFTDGGAIRWENDERFKAEHRIGEAIPGMIATLKRERLLATNTYPEYEMFLDFPRLWPNGETVRLHGRADFIYDCGGNGLTIVDGKGGGTFGRFTDRDQLRMYALAAKEDRRFRRLPTRVGFWWFRHDKVIWVKLTEAALEKFLTETKERIFAIAKQLFEPTPGSHCAPCPLRLSCEVGKQYGVSKAPTKANPALDVPSNAGIVGL